MTEPGFELSGAIYIYMRIYTYYVNIEYLRPIWKVKKAIHLNTKSYFNVIIPKGRSIFIILYLSIGIFLTWVIYILIFLKAKTLFMNETISI